MTHNQQLELQAHIRNAKFANEQELADFMLTLAGTLNEQHNITQRICDKVVDMLTDVCLYIEGEIIEQEQEAQWARESGEMYLEEKNEHNPDKYL